MDILDDANLTRGAYEPPSALLYMDESIGEVLPPSRLRRSRRRHHQDALLNITSFVDVLSVLLFFLLSVATLEKLGQHEVTLPRQTESFTQDSKLDLKNLSLSLARSGLTLRALATPEGKEPEALKVDLPLQGGRYDLDHLQEALLRWKGAYKTDEAMILLVGDDVAFEAIVQVMDTVREKVAFENGTRLVTTLFPQVSLADYLPDQLDAAAPVAGGPTARAVDGSPEA